MMDIEYFKLNGLQVAANADMRGKHRDQSLCHLCDRFRPMTSQNCGIAENLYRQYTTYGVVAPVIECGNFTPKKDTP